MEQSLQEVHPKAVAQQGQEAPSTKGKEIDTTLKFKINYALEGIRKEMDMDLSAKIVADVTLSVLKDKAKKMEKHQNNAKDYLSMYRQPT